MVLQSWCIHAAGYSRKRDHGSVDLNRLELLPADLLEARLRELSVLGSHMVKTDVELEALGAAVAAPSSHVAVVKGRGRGRGRPRGGHTPTSAEPV